MPAVAQERNVPESILALRGMDGPGYVDLFVATVDGTMRATPEQLAREAIEGASALGRFLAWRLCCGLRLDARSPDASLAGWRVDGRGGTWIRLAASSWFMTAKMVFLVEGPRASFATFIRYDRPIAARIWGAVSPVHRAVAPGFLGGAVTRLRSAHGQANDPAPRHAGEGGPR